MRIRYAGALLAAVVALLAPAESHAIEIVVRGDSLVGRVFDSSTNRGLSGYQVQLTAPRVQNLPVRIAVTDASGQYKFTHVRRGKYLLEVYRGLMLVSRREIDTSVPSQAVVRLRPVARAAVPH